MNFRSLISLLALAAVLLMPGTLFSQDKKPKVKKVTVKTVEGLRFEPVRFSVKRGETLELTIENHDPNDQPHNFVLIKPGALAEIQAASMAVTPEAAANGFVPKSGSILVHTGLLNPEQKETITIQAPEEPGIYHYVCTFPGHAMVMYGALYVDTKYEKDVPFDPNVPEMVRALELDKLKALVEVERPTFTRAFMPEAGPAAIAVALPGDLNFCWDAGNCRLRYAWSGAYIDATKMWNSNGNALVNILGDEFWNSGGGERTHGIQIGDESARTADFKGYAIIDGIPEFEYRIDDVLVREWISTGTDGELSWRFRLDAPGNDVRVFAPETKGTTISSKIGSRDGDYWVVPQKDAAEFTLHFSRK